MNTVQVPNLGMLLLGIWSSPAESYPSSSGFSGLGTLMAILAITPVP